MNLEGWDWLADLKKIAQKEESEKNQDQNIRDKKVKQKQIVPNFKYVADIIGGRAVFSHPSERGDIE